MNSIPSPHAPCVAIIGGGPAGLMAAERLAASGAVVTVYDRMPTVGRKFMIAGRGGLNLTHSESLERLIERYSDAAEWLGPVVTAFPPTALRKWCEGLGQETFVGSSGRIFPKSLKASPLLRAWLRRLDQAGVRFALRHRWQGWTVDGQLVFNDEKGNEVLARADATLLALGGASWPRLGSDGRWVDILQKQGIEIAPLRPANCGFIAPWSDVFGERFAGQPLKPITVSFADQTIQGEAMITCHGFEGGVIYALSSALRSAIEADGQATLTFDLRPGLSQAELAQRLAVPRGSQSASNFLRKYSGLSPVAIGLLRESVGAGLPSEAGMLAALIKATKIRLTETASLERAISSAGGIGRNELNRHFMLNKKPGVFAIGEMLDWEAPTGGYLLQASFSMAVAAAAGVRAYLAGALGSFEVSAG